MLSNEDNSGQSTLACGYEYGHYSYRTHALVLFPSALHSAILSR